MPAQPVIRPPSRADFSRLGHIFLILRHFGDSQPHASCDSCESVNRFDPYLDELRSRCADMPDLRTRHNTVYSMQDAGMAAFSVFHSQCPSFLAHQKAMESKAGLSNANTLYGLKRIPSDNHIRRLLDPVPPEHFDEAFIKFASRLDRSGALRHARRLGDRTLIALDGSEYFNSCSIGCRNCLTRKRSNGKTENYHAFLGAFIVAPNQQTALPLPPEIIRPQDGAAKQDCEINAGLRWMKRIGGRREIRRLRPVFLGDALFACQPFCDAVFAAGGNFILTVKPGKHKALHEHVAGRDRLEKRRTTVRGKRKKAALDHRWRWVDDVPVRGGDGAMKGTWIEYERTDRETGKTFRTARFTDLEVDRDNVEEFIECGRTRWKVENEGFNILKNHGYHMEHNFGHGKENLASVLLVFNLLAFAVHAACRLHVKAWQAARKAWGTGRRFFEALRSFLCRVLYRSWDELMEFLASDEGVPASSLVKQPP